MKPNLEHECRKKTNMTQRTEGRLNLNFQAHQHGVAFFEFLKHTKQDFSINEFKYRVSNLLRKLL